MSHTTHTPGPWQLKSEYDPYVVIGNVDGPDDGRFHFTIVCDVVTDDDDKAIANARLIAAAPDLLRVLKLLAAEVECLCNGQSVPLLEQARAAIAKAEGDTPADEYHAKCVMRGLEAQAEMQRDA